MVHAVVMLVLTTYSVPANIYLVERVKSIVRNAIITAGKLRKVGSSLQSLKTARGSIVC